MAAHRGGQKGALRCVGPKEEKGVQSLLVLKVLRAHAGVMIGLIGSNPGRRGVQGSLAGQTTSELERGT